MNGRTLLVLDPGHGGSRAAGASSPNRGTGPNGLTEKEVALDLARRVRDRLLPTHTVVLTRDGDTNPTLADRAGAARNLGADLFVSLHLSATDPVNDRTDVVVARDASPRSVALASALRQRVGAVTDAPGEVLRADLGQLAPDRHDARTAACLVEIASLAAPGRADLLAGSAYRDRMAEAIATALRESTAVPATAAPPWVGAARAQEIVTPDAPFTAGGLPGAAAVWADWLLRFDRWTKGVPDELLARFPHAAICQLTLTHDDRNSYYGTGFYIADEVLLSCGHNFLDGGHAATSVQVAPAYSPRMSGLPTATFAVTGADVVHPRWREGAHPEYDLSVLRVPGLRATAGVFDLANVSLAPEAGIVVCGYGKVAGQPGADQGQRMDGAHVSRVEPDVMYYPILTKGGHSGSPVFHGSMVVGVHTAGVDANVNRGVLLTPEKNDWIDSMAGTRLAGGLGVHQAVAVDANSPQSSQSAEVARRVARSVGRAEAGLRYDRVHDDSHRINVGIGSWTGTRIADLLDTYAVFAAEQGRTAQLLAHLGGQAGFDTLVARFRDAGVSAVLSAPERAMLAELIADTDLQGAQDGQLAADVRADLAAIGGVGDPWYPYIDAGTGAISEIAAHVLVHARHQRGGAGLRATLRAVITGFGGDSPLGQAMVAGTVTERDVLEAVAADVVSRVEERYREGARARYRMLFADHAGSPLSYYFAPVK